VEFEKATRKQERAAYHAKSKPEFEKTGSNEATANEATAKLANMNDSRSSTESDGSKDSNTSDESIASGKSHTSGNTNMSGGSYKSEESNSIEDKKVDSFDSAKENLSPSSKTSGKAAAGVEALEVKPKAGVPPISGEKGISVPTKQKLAGNVTSTPGKELTYNGPKFKLD